ncbi:MAG: hypothetical protein EDX89_18465 [Acidobacteria bacterium]|nr:MAG: hypothetical protein EDX89_18465 [Acidobacteriota bacterium]MCE7958742.1 hypothetical protein [Acidobacteria bacterium ACB2]
MSRTNVPSPAGQASPGSPSAPGRSAEAPPEPDLEQALFERDVARRIRGRLETEIRRLHHHISLVEADRGALRQRLEERERYVAALHSSVGWKLLQWARGLVGRRW